MKWFSKKNKLDEMQELKLLKIESKGFWLGFFGLFASILVQIFLYGSENIGKIFAGEFIVFLCMGIYLIAGCLKNGIWDRHLKATPAVNIGFSLLAAVITALFNGIVSYRNYQDLPGALIVFAITFLLVGVTASVALCVCSALYQQRRKRLEEEDNDEN